MVVAYQTLDNSEGKIDQKISFEFSKEISHTNTFSHEHGFKVGVSTTVEAKIPFVGKIEVSVSAETSHNWSYGKENSVASGFSGSTPV